MTPERTRREIAELARSRLDLPTFAGAATRAVRRELPFDGFCLIALDPATMLPTDEVVVGALPPAESGRLAEMEAAVERDANVFLDLARAPRPVATLSAATGGRLERSARHRELRAPNGFGDELRAVLVGDCGAWGALTLLRARGRPSFSEADVRRVAALVQPLEEGVRRAALVAVAPAARPVVRPWASADGMGTGPGLVVVGDDGSVARADAMGRRFLDELRPGHDSTGAPIVVRAVASRARAAASGRLPGSAAARARVRSRAGRWVTVHGSVLEEGPESCAVVVLEATPSADLAPLMAGAYGLTAREQAVTRLVAGGAATRAVARALRISEWTVHDHVKAVLAKTGTSSRGELVARLFLEPDVPRTQGQGDGRPGWSGR